jgi:hypothetical protein
MNCFNHRDQPAIGLCKSCAKALCEDCLVELPNGLACKGSCESRVNLLNRMIESNAKVMSAARHQVKSAGVFLVLLGLGFCIFSGWAYQEINVLLSSFFGFSGLAFLVLGIIRLSRKEAYPEIHNPSTSE